MDAGGLFSYMRRAMRILLLLMAFLVALGGVVTGSAATAQPIESSASIAPDAPTSVVAHAHIAPLPAALRAFSRTATNWVPVERDVALSARPLFRDRLRE